MTANIDGFPVVEKIFMLYRFTWYSRNPLNPYPSVKASGYGL